MTMQNRHSSHRTTQRSRKLVNEVKCKHETRREKEAAINTRDTLHSV